MAAADKARVPQASGAASASDWLAKTTNTEPAESSRQTKLAKDLCQQMLAGTQASLTKGELSTAHARVIAAALKRLPKDLTPEQVAAVEAALVAKAKRMDPKALHAAGRRALEASRRPAKVDAAEDAQLRDEEEAARAKTRCTLHDNGDGTMRITATVPTLAGAILKKILDQMSSPRRARLGATPRRSASPQPHRRGLRGPRRGDLVSVAPPPTPRTLGATQAQIGAVGNPSSEGFEWDRRRGEALVSLIEHLPTDHLHGKVAASVIVKLDHDSLLDGLAPPASTPATSSPPPKPVRLACHARPDPRPAQRESVLLDLGRSARFFHRGPTHRRRPEPRDLRRRRLPDPLRLV